MSNIDLSQQIEKLKREEEEQLAEMRLKRFLELESERREMEKRKEEEELKNLIAKERDLMKKLDEKRRRIFQLRMEATSWEKVAKMKTNELRNLEKKLDESYGRIWTNREDFCDKIDALFRDVNIYTTRTPQKERNIDSANITEEMKKLKESIAVEEDLEKTYTKTINELQKEKERLKQIPNGQEYKRLEEWIQITRDRCTELNQRIHDNTKSIDAIKNPDNNQLFSIVNLEDVKKLTQNWK